MDNQFKPLAVGEVLSVDESAQIFIGNRTFRVGEFLVAIKKKLVDVLGDEWTPEQESWFSESGIPCEVLQFSANNWQQGKVRLNLEFCVVEAEDKVDNISAIGGETLQSTSTQVAAQSDLTEPETSNDYGLELGVGAATAAVSAPEMSVAEALEEDTSTAISDEMTLKPTLDADEDIGFEQTPTTTEDEFDLGDFSDSESESEEDIGFEQTPTTTEDEFDLGDFSDSEEDIGFEQTPTTTEDEFDLGDFSDSEEDIEFVESPTAAEEDLLDLSAVSTDSNNDFDLGEMSDGSDEDMFKLDDISFDEESENSDDNSLMDDVWQEMNELK